MEHAEHGTQSVGPLGATQSKTPKVPTVTTSRATAQSRAV